MLALLQEWLRGHVSTVLLLMVAVCIWQLSGLARRGGRTSKRRAGSGAVVAFFHPYCDHGGGGERVLWVMVDRLLRAHPEHRVVIYSGGLKDVARLLQLVQTQFHLDLTPLTGRIALVNIASRSLLEAKWYPVATMALQCAASMLVGLECLARLQPDVFVDTTGAALCYPLFGLAGCTVVAYVHYPIISSDMLQLVRERRPTYNNAGRIAASVSVSRIKLGYYRLIAWGYSQAGACADVVMVNSAWTEGHIAALWPSARPHHRVYPPCNTSLLQALPLRLYADAPREPLVLSIGQFRPEKDHGLQLRAWQALRRRLPHSPAKLVLVGSARHASDDALVAGLRSLAADLGVADSVEFVVNAPYERVRALLSTASLGLHSMWNEHFGISVVEMMAAGLVVVAHDSGGPKMDIVVPAARAGPPPGLGIDAADDVAVGFLAATAAEYAACLGRALALSEQQRDAMRRRARAAVGRFSDDTFALGVAAAMSAAL